MPSDRTLDLAGVLLKLNSPRFCCAGEGARFTGPEIIFVLTKVLGRICGARADAVGTESTDGKTPLEPRWLRSGRSGRSGAFFELISRTVTSSFIFVKPRLSLRGLFANTPRGESRGVTEGFTTNREPDFV